MNRSDLSDICDILSYTKKSSLDFDDRVKFLYPMVDTVTEPLPKNLSIIDRSSMAKIESNNPLRVEYEWDESVREGNFLMGTNYNPEDHVFMQGADHIGCVRADHPIPPAAGLYYFEMKVLCEAAERLCFIGLTHSSSNLQRAPGWDRDTYGYHGDNGKTYADTLRGSTYGPTFGANDIIGCGLNLKNQTCFFTKNGHFLGMAFEEMPLTNLYPTVGVGSRNGVVQVNFGQLPFSYNIAMEQILYSAHTKDLKTET